MESGRKGENINEDTRYIMNTAQQMNELRKASIFTDFGIRSADNDVFQCHKVVLASCSNYFRAMLSENFKEGTSTVVTFQTLSSSGVKALLDYIYTGSSIHVTAENVQEILAAADMFLLNGLFNRCVEYLEQDINSQNCLDVFRLASRYNCVILEKKAWQAAVSFCKEVIHSKEFLQLSESELLRYIPETVLCQDDDTGYSWAHALVTWWHFDISRISAVRIILSGLRMKKCFVDFLKETESEYTGLLEEGSDGDECSGDNDNTTFNKDVGLNDRYTDEIVVLGGSPCLTSHFPSQNTTRENEDVLMSFSPFHKTWHYEIPNIPIQGSWFSATVINNMMVVTSWHAGRTWKYCAAIRQWVEVSGLKDEVTQFTLVTCIGYVYRIGGNLSVGGHLNRGVMRYDPIRDYWQKVSPMIQSLQSCCGVACKGKLYVIGPHTTDRRLSILCYSPQTDLWEVVTSLECAHSAHFLSAITLQGLIFIFSGKKDDVYCYNPVHANWRQTAQLNNSRQGCSAAVSRGKVYVLGGMGADGLGVTTVEEYDPDTDKWSVVADIPYPVESHSCLKLVVDMCSKTVQS
ncbi:kelch-like protein 24 [Glandiceps talaboti]